MNTEAKLKAYEDLAAHCRKLVREIEEGASGAPGVSPYGGMSDQHWRERETVRMEGIMHLLTKIEEAQAEGLTETQAFHDLEQ